MPTTVENVEIGVQPKTTSFVEAEEAEEAEEEPPSGPWGTTFP